ncbi:MAG TPA: hypothetical protein VFF35_04545, partial [Bacteroidia bacterium]|nr:hypothetical protein [Bacteroidia bacterium]
ALRSTLHISKWRSWCSIAKPGISINFAAHGFWFGAAIATCLYAKNVSRKHCGAVRQTGQSAFFIEQLFCKLTTPGAGHRFVLCFLSPTH